MTLDEDPEDKEIYKNEITIIERAIDNVYKQKKISAESAYYYYYVLATIARDYKLHQESLRLFKKFADLCEKTLDHKLAEELITTQRAKQCYDLLKKECQDWEYGIAIQRLNEKLEKFK